MTKIRDAFGRPWPRENVVRCVGKGWAPLVNRLIDDLFIMGWDGECHQVKEKFGGLRFYIGRGTDAMFDRIDAATDESLKTCENCGAPGKLRGRGWLYTSCDQCADPKEWK